MNKAVAALVILIGLLGLTQAAPAPEELTRVSLAKYEARWLVKRVRSYSFTLERSCFCAPRVASAQFKVNKGKVQVLNVTKGVSRETFTTFSSMDRLFAAMRQTLKKGGRVAAVFDASGLPRQVTLDPNVRATDDELYLTINGLNLNR